MFGSKVREESVTDGYNQESRMSANKATHQVAWQFYLRNISNQKWFVYRRPLKKTVELMSVFFYMMTTLSIFQIDITTQ